MTDEPPDETSGDDALKDLDKRLKAAESRERKPTESGAEVGVNKGFQALGELVGGILAGLGLGWLSDHFLHTTPWGMIIGTLLGMVAAVYAIVKSGQNRS